MTEDNNTNIEPGKQRRRVLFIVGVIIGLLAGAILTMLIVDWLDYKHPTVVKILEHSTPAGSKDTVINYVIHKHVNQEETNLKVLEADSLSQDSIDQETDYQDFMLDEDEIQDWQADEEMPQSVSEDKILKKNTIRITYMDENKRIVPTPANSPIQWQIQMWSTPIKNRLSYQYANNLLKVKGMDIENMKIVHFSNQFYLVHNNRTYLIKPNKQFEKLQEAPEMSFAIK